MALVTISKLRKNYGPIEAVRGVDMTIEKGEIVGLLGPNGAGKSSTISCISTLLQADGGTIFYQGQPLEAVRKTVRKKIGLVPQEIALYPTLKGRDNLRFFGGIYGLKGEALDRAVERVSATIGIVERLDTRVATYSGGMKRRLNIGCALLHQPELLIMDEPTVGIDPQSRRHILDTVKALNRQEGLTVLYTSHYMEEVQDLCEKIYIMDEGKVIASGRHAELMAAYGGDEYLEIAFESDASVQIEALEAIGSVSGVTAENGGYLLRTTDAVDTMRALVDLSKETGVALKTLVHQQANLETLFLELTGKALRD